MEKNMIISFTIQNSALTFLPLLVKLSLIASVMALIVLGIRFCLRKAPKVYSYILWIFVFIRAVLPVSYSSAYSLWNTLKRFFSSPDSAERMIYAPTVSPVPAGIMEHTQNTAAFSSVSRTGSLSALAGAQTPDIWTLTAAVWLLGVSVLLVYSAYSMRKLKKSVRFSTLTSKDGTSANVPVYESDRIRTAFILGFFHPVIYLPKGLSDYRKRLILEHESVHIRRHDHQIKLAAWLILSLHWFNPLMWASFRFLNKDMELSCDEQVLIHLGSQVRTDYSSLLLDLAAPGRISSGMPLAFSEGNTQNRIKNILNYKPIKFGSAAAAVLLLLITVYGCMGNPEKEPDSVSSTAETEAIVSQNTETEHAPKEELTFVKDFVQNLIDCHAEDVYAVLSPELKKEADTFYSSLGIGLHEPGIHRRINPFTPTDAPVIEKTKTGYVYRMTRPDYRPAEYMKFHPADIWEGSLTLSQSEGEFMVTKWEDYNYNEIASKEEFDWQYEHYPFFEDASAELEWIKSHPEEASDQYLRNHSATDPETLITERFHLTQGSVTDVSKDEEKKLQNVTYSWQDGSVIFRMEQLYDQFWYVTGADALN